MEVINANGTISRDLNAVLNKWKTFSDKHGNRVDRNMNINTSYSDDGLNHGILAQDVAEVMRSMKNNKAYGVGELPTEIIKNNNLIHLLTVLFNKCFESDITTEIWKMGITQPIPKSSTMDSRDP